MAILSALAAISAIAFQGGTLTLGGKVVQINYPTPAVRQVPEDVKTWDGFGSLPAGLREWPTPFQAPGDWSQVTAKLAELGPVAKDAPQWKTKIFLVTQSDSATKTGDGVFRQKRHRLNQKQIDDLLRALARVPGYARAATNGALNVSLDVVIDSEPVIYEAQENAIRGMGSVSATSTNPNDRWLADYIMARTNRGAFVAEDKVFVGPYQTVIFFGPNLLEECLSKELDGYGIEERVASAIAREAVQSWIKLGVYSRPIGGAQGGYYPHLPSTFPATIWQALQTNEEPSFEKLQELYAIADQVRESSGNSIEYPWRPAPFSGNVSASIAADEDRGSVLKYGENSPVRHGGFSLPYQNIDVTKTPFLSFWVKSRSKDTLSLYIEVGGNKGRYSSVKPIPVNPDGIWRNVIIDLRDSSPRTVQEIYIGPPRGTSARDQVGDIIYLFDDFQLLGEGQVSTPPVDLDSDLVRRAVAAKELSATELVKEVEDFVKLNGLLGHESPYATSDEEALIQLSKNVNVRIAGEAVKKLAQIGTPTARAEILRLVVSSPFEHVKQVAAIEVGKFGDPKMAGLLSRLFASRNWQTRMAGAKAVASLPGDEAAVISMTFLQETDSQIRLVLTRSANAQNSVVQKRLLWSTVNDPSDSVRAESAWRLITSGKESLATEGYKAIRDDSNWVRMELLDRMTANPGEAHRPTLRLAITDLSPRVRAATLAALAKQPGEVSLAEVANVLQDKFPQVQLALIELAKAKKLTLPAESLTALRASIDPRVVEKVKELGQ